MSLPINFLNFKLTDDRDLTSLCASSLSESSQSSFGEEDRFKKVIDRRYSRLAFTVRNVGKAETDEANLENDVDDESSICPPFFDLEGRDPEVSKSAVRNDVRPTTPSPNCNQPVRHDNNIVVQTSQSDLVTTIDGEEKKKKVMERKYSRLAFSVRFAGKV